MAARRLRVQGLVQGVGFRPFVWRLARELALTGWVRNDGWGVEIHLQGSTDALVAFQRRLPAEAPPLARIAMVTCHEARAEVLSGFTILESASGPVRTAIGADTGVCADCLREMFTPSDRRWRHAFISCTHCGPRYTVTRALPYDRAQTSLASFPLCADCQREYTDPIDRRFHAETTCCPACGPRLSLLDAAGLPIEHNADPIALTLALIRAGQIVALKGLGGFHLCCDARNGKTVARLRARKQREAKPFALMLASPSRIDEFALSDAATEQALTRQERPIVLLPKRENRDNQLPGIAPGLHWLGVMLPYTPLHYLLFHEAAGRPAGLEWLDEVDLALVMTSANPGGEPIVLDNDEAFERLGSVADAFLLHDREIVARCDDSVIFPHGAFVRRARGFAPQAIRLPHAGPAVLACGALLKNTICVTRDDLAYLSPHLGDLDTAAGCALFEETVQRMLALTDIQPQIVAHDRHVDFFSTRFARQWAQRHGLSTIAVQHHHAHLAAVTAEHHLSGPLLGLALDGVGLGDDGGAWGGELLWLDGARYQRLGHLRPLPLPGGDKAAREPWRLAVAALHLLGRDDQALRRYAERPVAQLIALIEQGIRAPLTSSAGRWFDAAAALLGLAQTVAYEGQAAMQLEAAALRHGPAAPLSDGFHLPMARERRVDGPDFLPLLGWMADQSTLDYPAAVFHATVTEGLAQWLLQATRLWGIDQVVLAGGCFLNQWLSSALRHRLQEAGLRVYEAQQAPPNDGGISLGQAWITIEQQGE